MSVKPNNNIIKVRLLYQVLPIVPQKLKNYFGGLKIQTNQPTKNLIYTNGIKEWSKTNQALTLISGLLYLGSQMGHESFNIFYILWVFLCYFLFFVTFIT